MEYFDRSRQGGTSWTKNNQIEYHNIMNNDWFCVCIIIEGLILVSTSCWNMNMRLVPTFKFS
jgi:hypothetical protein